MGEEGNLGLESVQFVGEGQLLNYTELDQGNQQPTGLKLVEAPTPGTVKKASSTTTKKTGIFHYLDVGCVLYFDNEEDAALHVCRKDLSSKSLHTTESRSKGP